MDVERLLERRQPAWRQLASLIQHLQKVGPRKAKPGEVPQLLQLYQDACADLARLRTLDADPAVEQELNHLVCQAHGLIYRSSAASRRFSLWRFYFVTYPRLFRQTWRFTLASFLLSLVVSLMAFQVVQSHPEIVADILGGMDQEFVGDKQPGDIRDRFDQAPSSVLMTMVTTNNIGVAITAFALGITFGIGTVFVLIMNSAMLGGIAGAFAQSGQSAALWMTILPHGALELSAIVWAGGAGFVLAWPLWRPGRRTRRLALREEAGKAVRLAVGLIPAFIVAGMLEGFVTPPHVPLPDWLKVAIGVFAALVFWAHLLLAGREPANEPRT